jgi:hypothetical protein
VRVFIAFENFRRRLTGNPFRSFLHSAGAHACCVRGCRPCARCDAAPHSCMDGRPVSPGSSSTIVNLGESISSARARVRYTFTARSR